jgi:hypothetical protein
MWFRRDSKKRWWIDDGIEDAARFFDLIRTHLPEATHIGAEGTQISEKAHELYVRYADPQQDRAPHDVLWPLSDRYTCRCSAAFWSDIVELATASSNSDLLHHMSLYAGNRTLLTWHDAFALGSLTLDADVPEPTVSAIAGAFGVQYGKQVW